MDAVLKIKAVFFQCLTFADRCVLLWPPSMYSGEKNFSVLMYR